MEDVKYCVILREGETAGKEQYFSATKEKLEEIFNSFKFDVDGEVYAWLGHIAGQNKGEIADELKIDKKNRLLEFRCQNETTANRCVKYFKLPLPFPDTN